MLLLMRFLSGPWGFIWKVRSQGGRSARPLLGPMGFVSLNRAGLGPSIPSSSFRAGFQGEREGAGFEGMGPRPPPKTRTADYALAAPVGRGRWGIRTRRDGRDSRHLQALCSSVLCSSVPVALQSGPGGSNPAARAPSDCTRRAASANGRRNQREQRRLGVTRIRDRFGSMNRIRDRSESMTWIRDRCDSMTRIRDRSKSMTRIRDRSESMTRRIQDGRPGTWEGPSGRCVGR